MDNPKEIQDFKSFKVITVFVLLAICVIATYPVINSQKSENEYKALHRAEGLAYQLIEIHKNLMIPMGSRAVASIDEEANFKKNEIGLDPWGRAFNFEVIDGPHLEVPLMVVWSAGENGILETKKTQFLGDDIGVMIEIR